MSHCGEYYLEDELGYFLNYISGENDSINFEYYINRFVNIEGDSIACTECVSIDVTSIDIAYDCQQPINCFSNPCSTSNCYSNQIAECIPNYCGGCWLDYFLDNDLIAVSMLCDFLMFKFNSFNLLSKFSFDIAPS